MEIPFHYGHQTVPVQIKDHNIAGIVGSGLPAAANPREEIEKSLGNPIASPRLQEIVKRKGPGSIVILVTDVSRPIPYQEILEAVLREILAGGVKKEQVQFIIATGAHRPNTETEIKEVFGSLAGQYPFLNHDCDKDLVNLGTLTGGAELYVNKRVAEADMVITTGCIMPHNLAGFSGGPKLILPGVAGRKTIEQNHRMMTNQGVGPGKIMNNPIHHQMLEAAERLRVYFGVNVILNEQNDIVKCFAGELTSSWLEGCRYCQRIYRQTLPTPEEVVVAGAGGYPRDLNLYQSVKALINGARLAKPGGTVVLLARCQEGMGEPVFQQWVEQGKRPEDVVKRFQEQGFVLGGHKAYVLCNVLKNKEVILISDLAKSKNPVPLLKNAEDWATAEKMIIEKHGPDYRALMVPFAGLVFPLSDQETPSDK
ncbi:nickel-dependent lactate racemase [Desulforamulus putei]|uniref:Nickel-dependent lactate racemase n=1 Tax=Desulforamulus putei DSM 12395 TaxID=1121429 RepID=A0A1M4XBA8_9FIRM|nr:nickel-dependent lactate racemase [Desulforamulus putei]SHE90695.1 Nickel-dependent lactate racemase [Desulforamulus putei DSM 12395]